MVGVPATDQVRAVTHYGVTAADIDATIARRAAALAETQAVGRPPQPSDRDRRPSRLATADRRRSSP